MKFSIPEMVSGLLAAPSAVLLASRSMVPAPTVVPPV